VNAPGFQALIRLLKSGRGLGQAVGAVTAPRCASRLTTTSRRSRRRSLPPRPGRLVWGSDWPHVLLETTMPNDGDLVDQIAVWVPDEACAQAHPGRQSGRSTASSGLTKPPIEKPLIDQPSERQP
jgi:predicted TIM-barrel fold metal-dependent hydrolase